MKRNDLGIGQLKKDLLELRSSEVVAGIMGDKARSPHPDAPGHTVAEVASWLEYGTKAQPARPALQRTMSENKDQIQAAIRKAGSDLVDARIHGVSDGLAPLVDAMRKALIQTFATSREWAAENAESTKRAKGHDQPLVGSSFSVQQAIDAEVRPRK